MQALRDSTPRGADGFNQRFGIPAAVGDRPWAAKQGWTCCTQPSPMPDGVMLHTTGTILSDRFMAETFLVQDTGIKDSAGKGIIDVFGGIKYGWQVRSV